MKEKFNEEERIWIPIIDITSKELQPKYRIAEFRATGKCLDEELENLNSFIEQLLIDNPGLWRYQITMSTEGYSDNGEDKGVISFLYYTLETEEERDERLRENKKRQEREIKLLNRLK